MVSRIPHRLLRRKFSLADQADFAKLSGDFNPLHIDPIEARRTLIGAPVVHGMHLVLAVLDRLLGFVKQEHAARLAFLGDMRARFRQPTLVGESIEFRLAEFNDAGVRVEGTIGDELVMEVAASFGGPGMVDNSPAGHLEALPLHDLGLDEVNRQSGVLQVGLDLELARRLFGNCVSVLGPAVTADLCAVSRLVGMRCPGRHSLLSGFEVILEQGKSEPEMDFEVGHVDERFRRLTVSVRGMVLRGKAIVFVRPPPQEQPPFRQVAERVNRDEFAGATALIIGGSRGLGAVTARIIAAGGGQPIATFHRGAEDAEALAREVREAGASCETAQFDVRRPDRAIKQLFSRYHPRSIYYFATPRIFGRRRSFFSRERLQEFLEFYALSLVQLLNAIPDGAQKVRIFVPSTVAIDDELREIAEYAIAKRAAEEVCAFYNRYSNKVDIVVERLPRIKTDQTLTLTDVPASEGIDVMLPIVRRVESGLHRTSTPVASH